MEKTPERLGEEMIIAEDREVLAAKLAEYRSRTSDQKFATPSRIRDTVYKIAVLEPLVLNGQVERSEVLRGLEAEHGPVDMRVFDNAWSVIGDYLRSGGKHLSGGTGLPDRAMDEP